MGVGVTALATLSVMAVFVVLVAARALLQWRRTGDSGLRVPFTGGGPVPWELTLFVLGGVVAGVVAPLAELAGLGPLPPLDVSRLRWTGVVLAAVGVLATFGCQLAMGASWRIGVAKRERTSLVTRGPFRLVRHPIYSAVAVAFAGAVLGVPNVVALVGWLLLVMGMELQVRRVEEPHLRRIHPSAWPRYASRTGRFLPGVGRIR